MPYWKGKRCLITGGTSGLGLSIARQLAERQAAIALVGRDLGRLERAAAELRSLGATIETFSGDVSAPDVLSPLLEEIVSRLGGLDFACHAAGRSMRGELLKTTPTEFESLWRINTWAAFELARVAAPALSTSRGHLVLIGSLASRVAPRYIGAYPASKFPLMALAQQLRLEQGPAGLHTLLVCPGPIRRDGEEPRYRQQAAALPPGAQLPGGGAKVKALDPEDLAKRVLRACEKRQSELVLPARARWLFVINQISPNWGDWLLGKMSS
jgi:uncharacterized protein